MQSHSSASSYQSEPHGEGFASHPLDAAVHLADFCSNWREAYVCVSECVSEYVLTGRMIRVSPVELQLMTVFI